MLFVEWEVFDRETVYCPHTGSLAGDRLYSGVLRRICRPARFTAFADFLRFRHSVGGFFSAYSGWRGFRAFVQGFDLRFAAVIQAWRWAGLGFLSLYAHGILPGLFAFPAGLGDMAIGFSAPAIVLGLIRDSSFATSRRFVLWNIMGIMDLVVAVSLGAICSGFLPGLTGTVTTAPMAQFPLIFVPAYLVPLFIMLHATALLQARQLVRSEKSVLGH